MVFEHNIENGDFKEGEVSYWFVGKIHHSMKRRKRKPEIYQ